MSKKIILNNGTAIDIPSGPIGISCSGGTDSSLLLYILMKNVQDTIHVFTCSNNKKGRANAIVVPRVIEKCIQLTGNINVVQHSWYTEKQTEKSLFDYQRSLLSERKINCIFYAVTANPSLEDIKKYFSGEGESDRDPGTLKPESSYNGFLRTPFINKNKKDICEIYKDFQLLDTLFPLTRSCEAAGRIEYYEHCGNCWWCEERKWGFGSV